MQKNPKNLSSWGLNCLQTLKLKQVQLKDNNLFFVPIAYVQAVGKKPAGEECYTRIFNYKPEETYRILRHPTNFFCKVALKVIFFPFVSATLSSPVTPLMENWVSRMERATKAPSHLWVQARKPQLRSTLVTHELYMVSSSFLRLPSCRHQLLLPDNRITSVVASNSKRVYKQSGNEPSASYRLLWHQQMEELAQDIMQSMGWRGGEKWVSVIFDLTEGQVYFFVLSNKNCLDFSALEVEESMWPRLLKTI